MTFPGCCLSFRFNEWNKLRVINFANVIIELYDDFTKVSKFELEKQEAVVFFFNQNFLF